jgi:hypothetical protein
MAIGEYRNLVTLEHAVDPSVVFDPPDWYCAIQSSAVVAGGEAAYVLRGHYHPDITLDTQVIFEGRTLQVQGIEDVNERHVDLQLSCVEVVARGR